jgi:hypothetical protein
MTFVFSVFFFNSELLRFYAYALRTFSRPEICVFSAIQSFEFYFLFFTFFTVENAKTGSETKSTVPHILTIWSACSIPVRLPTANIIVAVPIVHKLIAHIKLIFFESILHLHSFNKYFSNAL